MLHSIFRLLLRLPVRKSLVGSGALYCASDLRSGARFSHCAVVLDFPGLGVIRFHSDSTGVLLSRLFLVLSNLCFQALSACSVQISATACAAQFDFSETGSIGKVSAFIFAAGFSSPPVGIISSVPGSSLLHRSSFSASPSILGH
jgi:hypothetical protein